MSKKSVSVSQYKDGNLIAKYHSISFAAKMNGVQPSHISKVAKGKRASAGGFGWKTTKSFTGKMKSGIVQSNSTETLAVYKNADHAATVSSIKTNALNNALNKNRCVGGYTRAS